MFKDACQCRTKLSGGCNTYNKQPGLPMAEWRTVFTNSKHFLEVLWQSWANASSAVILFVRQIFDASDWTCIQGGHSPELIFNNKTTTTYQVSTPGLWRVNGRVTHSKCHSVTSQARETIRAKLRACSDFICYRYHLPISSEGGMKADDEGEEDRATTGTRGV